MVGLGGMQIEIFEKFLKMKKLWTKNEISISTFDKSSLYQLKKYLWSRNPENRIPLEKLVYKHVHCPYNLISCPIPRMNISIIQKIIFLSTPTYFEMTLSTMSAR